MSTPSAIVAIEKYLVVNGPSKAAVIAKAIHVSETTARKTLTQLVADGIIVKDGQQYAWNTKRKKAKSEAAVNPKRAEVQARDAIVFDYLKTYTASDGKTISRNALREALKKQGHDLSGSHVYLSLFRLHEAGLIMRVNVGHRAPEWRMKY